jgi:predicted transposase/invertase (TIGR01784 family)
MKMLDPMKDLVFKALFGKEDKTSKILLMTLLNDILEKEEQGKIVEVHHLNPFNYKEFKEDKLSILDIKAKTDREEIINVEVQVDREDNYRKRSLYYWSKSYGEGILDSEEYEKLKKAIVINILSYAEIVESKKIHTTFKIMEKKEGFLLLDELEIHYLELTKLGEKKIEELSNVELWLEFLKEGGKKGNKDKLEKLKERRGIMTTAIEKLGEISADEKMRELYRAREKARLDMVSKLKYAERKGIEKGRVEGKAEGREEGIEKGRAEGREEGKAEGRKEGMEKGRIEGREKGIEEGRIEERKKLAKRLLNDGLEATFVSKYTNLSVEELKELIER